MPCHMKRNCLQKHVAISRGGKGEQHVLFSLTTMRHFKAEIQFNDYRHEKLISKTVRINEGTYVYIYVVFVYRYHHAMYITLKQF